MANWDAIFTARHSGIVLDARGGSLDNGTRIQQYDFHGAWNQRWRLVPVEAGWVRIEPDANQPPGTVLGICLDVHGVSRSNGAAIQLWRWWGGQNQQWRVEAAPGAGGPWVRIVARHSGLCLDIDGASRDRRAPAHQWEYHNGENQHFLIVDGGRLAC